MGKYRKKPVVIEAIQYTNEMRMKDQLPDGVVISYWANSPHGPGDYPTIHTLEGPHLVSEGDFVITGVQGERYPCKPDIFKETYEVEEEIIDTACYNTACPNRIKGHVNCCTEQEIGAGKKGWTVDNCPKYIKDRRSEDN